MITYVLGNLLLSPTGTLVNTVNVVGVMGKGIARDFRSVYPEMFRVYKQQCNENQVVPGRLHLFKTQHKSILNFPTKRHWRQQSRLSDIEAGLESFNKCLPLLELESAAFPQLGCGNGGLDWKSEVKPLMEEHLGTLPIPIHIHISDGSLPEGWTPKNVRTRLRMTPRALSFEEFWSILTNDDTQKGAQMTMEAMRQLEPKDGLATATDKANAVLNRVAVERIWQVLSRNRVVTKRELSDLPPAEVSEIFSALRLMPLVAPVAVAPSDDKLAEPDSQGFVLVLPPSKRSALPFESISEFEVAACERKQTLMISGSLLKSSRPSPG